MNLEDKIRAAREALRTGADRIEVPASTELFVTPPDVAARMAGYLGLDDPRTGWVLEPSAGTGALIRAVWDINPEAWVKGFERERSLVDASEYSLTWQDFLEVAPPGGTGFGPCSHVIMNPPFRNGADIRHVRHALKFLRPDFGTLVALVADGPRQARAFPESEGWEDLERLPAGTFSGTSVRTRIIRYRL